MLKNLMKIISYNLDKVLELIIKVLKEDFLYRKKIKQKNLI